MKSDLDGSHLIFDRVHMNETLTIKNMVAYGGSSLLLSNFILEGEVNLAGVNFEDTSYFTCDGCVMNTTAGFKLCENIINTNAVMMIRNSTFWGDTLAFGREGAGTFMEGGASIIIRTSSFNVRAYDSNGGTLRLHSVAGSVDHDSTNTHSGPNVAVIKNRVLR